MDHVPSDSATSEVASDLDNKTIKRTKIYSRKLYIFCYILIFMYLGAFWCIPSAIFTLIQQQLHISTKQTGLLWSMYDIMYGLAAITSGVIIDKYKSTHIYNALFLLISIISLCTMHLIKQYILMLLTYIILSYSQAVLDCSIAVYIYKLFAVSDDRNAAFLLTICYVVATIVSFVFVPIIDLSLQLFNTYSYSMYILAIFSIPSFILILILPTPTQKINKVKTDTNITKLPTEQLQLTLINYTSIHVAGLLGLGLAKQNIKTYVHDIKTVTAPDMKESGQSTSNALTVNKTVSRSINIPTPTKTINISPSPSWFDIEIPVLKEYKNSVSFMEMDILESNTGTDIILQNKFDIQMETIREQLEMDCTVMKSATSPRVTHDFNAIQKQKKLIKFFAIINMCLVGYFQSQKVIFGAYLSIYTMEYMHMSKKNALYFVTAFFGGIFCGKCLAIYLLKKHRADDIILFCCICMEINSIVFIIMHILFGKNIINSNVFKYMLYLIVIIEGTMSSPLFNASYAFLSLIQPVTGFVTSLLFAGYCIGGAITAYAVGILCDQFNSYVVPYCAGIQIFACLCIGITIKIRYVRYQRKYQSK
eukprot:59738_1